MPCKHQCRTTPYRHKTCTVSHDHKPSIGPYNKENKYHTVPCRTITITQSEPYRAITATSTVQYRHKTRSVPCHSKTSTVPLQKQYRTVPLHKQYRIVPYLYIGSTVPHDTTRNTSTVSRRKQVPYHVLTLRPLHLEKSTVSPSDTHMGMSVPVKGCVRPGPAATTSPSHGTSCAWMDRCIARNKQA